MIRLLLALLLSLAFATESSACHRHRRCRPVRCGAVYARAYAAAPAVATFTPLAVGMSVPVVTPTVAQQSDPSGFVAWLNAHRASHGLAAVAWSAQVAADAAHNSSIGLGHSHFGAARRQNAGWGAYADVLRMWVASPAHNDALLDPSIRFVGIAVVNGVWTYGAH